MRSVRARSVHSSLVGAILTAEVLWRGERESGLKGVSIIVREGTYTDDFNLQPGEYAEEYAEEFAGAEILEDDDPTDFAYEVVGVKDVRLVVKNHDHLHIGYVGVTLKNLDIIDCRSVRTSPTVTVRRGADAEFIGVRILAPQARALGVYEKARLSLVQCEIVDCLDVVLCDNSEMVFTDCKINRNLKFLDSVLKATNTSFSNARIIFNKTRVTLVDCKISGNFQPEEHVLGQSFLSDGLEIFNGSSVFLQRSSLSHYSNAVWSEGSDSRFIAEDCVITECNLAFELELNSNGLVKNCKFQSEFVCGVSTNVKGKVKFQNNVTIDGSPPKMCHDSMSVPPRHDFPDLELRRVDYLEKELPSDKEQSANTRRAYGAMFTDESKVDDLALRSLIRSIGTVKHCNRCRHMQMPSHDKMKFCVGCRKVSYCSKECQKADWGDHQLVCRSKQ